MGVDKLRGYLAQMEEAVAGVKELAAKTETSSPQEQAMAAHLVKKYKIDPAEAAKMAKSLATGDYPEAAAMRREMPQEGPVQGPKEGPRSYPAQTEAQAARAAEIGPDRTAPVPAPPFQLSRGGASASQVTRETGGQRARINEERGYLAQPEPPPPGGFSLQSDGRASLPPPTPYSAIGGLLGGVQGVTDEQLTALLSQKVR